MFPNYLTCFQRNLQREGEEIERREEIGGGKDRKEEIGGEKERKEEIGGGKERKDEDMLAERMWSGTKALWYVGG